MALDSAVVVSTGNQVLQIATWLWPMLVTLIGIIFRHPIADTANKMIPKKKAKG